MKPWFKLDPHNKKDNWWLYASIRDTNAANKYKDEDGIICILALQHDNNYSISAWFENDINRYLLFYNDIGCIFDKQLTEMQEGDVIHFHDMEFIVYDCKFEGPKKGFCKILERICHKTY